MKKRLLSLLLVLAMVVSLIPSTLIPTALAASPGVDISTATTLDISNGATVQINGVYTLTGSATESVVVEQNVTAILVLNNVTINSATAPIVLKTGAAVTLVIVDDTNNTLTSTSTKENAAETNAGIHVPADASLTIDIPKGSNGTGRLTVTGGYGGAGIGASFKQAQTATQQASGTGGEKGGNGGNPNDGYTNGGIGGAGGKGGTGGFDGANGYNAGVINIKGGIITATGGTGGAGIGGSRGSDGQAGGAGAKGVKGSLGGWNNTNVSYAVTSAGAGGWGGSGAGGNGGDGGDGGAGGEVTISGGSVYALGTDGGAGIGGGAGGTGGAGGNGGESQSDMNGQVKYVANESQVYASGGGSGISASGDNGYGGYGGNGGVSGSLSIIGGEVTAKGAGAAAGFGGGSGGANGSDGNTPVVTEAKIHQGVAYNAYAGTGAMKLTPEGEVTSVENYTWNSGNPKQSKASSGGKPGDPGKATVRDVKVVSNGASEAATITNSDNNIDFLGSNDKPAVDSQPKDRYGISTYRLELTVYNLDKDELIAGATVKIPVGSGIQAAYTYTTVTDNSGKAVLWLPANTYVLKNRVVSHPVKGAIPTKYMVTTVVQENNDNKEDVQIGVVVDVTANEDKVYTDGTNKPVTINVSATAVEGTMNNVYWFAEALNNNNNEYEEEAQFMTAYNAASQENKGTFDVTGNVKQWNLTVKENGRYWFLVKYTVDGEPGYALVPIDIKNIYRKYQIKVRSYVLEDDYKSGITEYENLKTENGVENKTPYGFAWDLNGYNVNNWDGRKLLNADLAAYDTVNIYVSKDAVTWYNPTIAGSGEGFNENSAGDGYLPFVLTLNPTFLSDQNTHCDTDDDGNKQYDKYSIAYVPKDGALNVVTFEGIERVDGGDDKVLYTNQISYTKFITEDIVTPQTLTGKKLVGVTVDGVDKTAELVENPDGSKSLHLKKIHGDPGQGNKVKKVQFIYEDNMTEVTIKAYYKGTTTTVAGYREYTTPMEIGTKVAYNAPVIDGHVNDGSTMVDGSYTVVEDGEIIFYYYKSNGNVTYKAVLDDGNNTVIWTKDGTVAKGQAPAETLPTDATFNIMYERKANDVAQIVDALGTTVTVYDGVNDLTVTYTYIRKTREVTIKQINIDTMQAVAGTADSKSTENVGEYATINAPALPAGYELVGNNSQVLYIAPNGDLVVSFYYKASDKATITIKLYASEEDKTDDTPFNTISLSGHYDVEQEINAPTVIGWELKNGEQNKVTLTPIRNDADSLIAKFVYDPVYDDITVKLTDEGGADLPAADLPNGWAGTFQVQQGQSFKFSAPSIPNYKLADGETLEKSLTADEIAAGTKTLSFKYTKAEADLITITVEGKVDGTTIYSYTKSVRKSATQVQIEAFAQSGYKIQNVTMDNVDVPGTVQGTDTVYTVNPNGADKTVVVNYVSNTAKVTINAYYKGTQTTVEGFTPFTVDAEIGKPYTYGALTINGYDNDGTIPSITSVAANNNELNYYFTRQTGNVIYKLVDANNPNTVLATKSETVNKGDAIDKTAAKAPTALNWKLQDANAEGTVEGADVGGKYDGVTAVTVTYKAVAKTKTVTIVRYDVDSGAQIPLSTTETAANKSLTVELETGKLHKLSKATYLPEGYTISGADQVELYVEDDNQARTVSMYFRNSGDEDVTVNLVYEEGGQTHTIQTYTVQRKPGTSITVKAPDLSARGFNTVDTEKTVTKDEDTVELKYTVVYYDITVKLVDNAGQDIPAPGGFQTAYKVRKSEGFTVTAPSIQGYTLTSTLVVTKTAAELETEANRTITFSYTPAAQTDYVNHTVILYDNDLKREITRYNSVVGKGAGKTKYFAPYQEGYQVDAKEKELSNDQSGEVTFNYTSNAATITIKFVDNAGQALQGQADVTLTGYQKGQTVMVSAPSVENMALAGLWKDNNLQTITGVTTTVTIPTTENNVDVTFAYKGLGAYNFKLVDQNGKEIKVVTAAVGDVMSVAKGGKLDLSDSGWDFDHANAGNTAPFTTENAELTISDATTVTEYTLYFTRQTRNVTYKYYDITNGEANKTEITGVTDTNPTTANVAEQLVVVAPQIPGYTATELRKSIPVGVGADAIVVEFEYTKKQTGSVTVKHMMGTTIISSYTASGSVGEWFTASVLALDTNKVTTDGKYKFKGTADEETKTVQVTAAAQEITFEYEANFITISTHTKIDGTETEYESGIELNKTASASQKLYAPNMAGYVLQGITVTEGATTEGSETTYPKDWLNNVLTLSGRTQNVKVVYHYAKIEDAMKDYQATVTVKAQYGKFYLGSDWKQTVTKNAEAEIQPKSYEGFVLNAYQISESGGKQTIASNQAASFILKYRFGTDETVIFSYDRIDDATVLPGPDGQIPSKDDITVKPDEGGTVKPKDDKDDGTVEIEGGATVERPDPTDPDKKEEIKVPDGTVINPDGKIELPDGTEIKPGDKLPDGTDPDETFANNYFAVIYQPGDGKGDTVKQLVKKNDSIKLLSGGIFTAPTSKYFEKWLDNNNTDYPAGEELFPTQNVTLTAQWKELTPAAKYKATIKLHNTYNNAQDTQIIESVDSSTITQNIKANPFSAATGWILMGWNTKESGNGTFYKDGASVTLQNGAILSLYTVWYKQDGSNIVLPGVDGKPGNDDDLTVKPGANGGNPTVDTDNGYVTAPDGSTIVKPDNKVIEVVKGPIYVYPDGTVQVPDGSSVKNPDGTTTEGPATVKPDGSIDGTDPSKPTEDGKGNIILPGKDGILGTDDDVTVTPDKGDNGKDNSKIDPDNGNVTLPDGGNVKYPDAPAGNGSTVTVPDGTVIKPDGSIILPEDGNGSTGGGGEIPGGSTIDPDGTINYRYTIKYIGVDKADAYVLVKKGTTQVVEAPYIRGYTPDKDSVSVTGGEKIDGGFVIAFVYTAQDGSVELPGTDGKYPAPDDKDNVIVKPDEGATVKPNPDGSIEIDGGDGTVERPDPTDPNYPNSDKKEEIKVPDGSVIKPDGTIELPDGGGTIKPTDKIPDGTNPDETISGYVTVIYQPGEGSGNIVKQLVKYNEDATTLSGGIFTAPLGKIFSTWKDNNGTKYSEGENIGYLTANLILTAVYVNQNPDGSVILPGQDGKVPTKDDITVTPDKDGTVKPTPDGGVEIEGGGGTVERPDPDDKNYPNGGKEEIKVPEGTEIKPDGTIKLPDGTEIKPGDKLPDGTNPDQPIGNYFVVTYVANGGTGSEVKQFILNGNQHTLLDGTIFTAPSNTYFDGWMDANSNKYQPGTALTVNKNITLSAQWKGMGTDKPVQKPDEGTIILPGKDGTLNTEDDVTVTPGKDNNGNDNSKIDPDNGKVTLPDGGEVKYPEPPAGSGTTVVVPGGTVIDPDGTIHIPEGGTGTIKPDGGTIPGGSTIDPDGTVNYRYTINFVGVSKSAEYVTVKKGFAYTYNAPHFNGYDVDQQSRTWNGGELFNGGYTVTFTYTKSTSGGNNGGGNGGGSTGGIVTTIKYTITASAGNGGSISPDGKTSVNSGSDKAYTISANNGYRVKDVLVDGKSVGAVSIYVFEKVAGDHTISVTFEAAKPAADNNVANPEDTGVSQWLRYTDHSAYMNGYGDGQFGARDDLNRAQAAQMFYNLLVNPNVEITVSFEDVPADAWYATAVNTLASLGIVNGVGDNRFEPERSITRAEFTAMATRFAKATEKMTISPFDDVSTEAWFFGCVVTAVSYGWIDGYGNGMFGPMDNINRAQAVTIVNRMLARSADREFVGANGALKQFSDVAEKDWFYYQVMEATNGHNHGYSADGYEIWNSLQK